MNPGFEFFRKHVVHHSMLFDPRLAAKRFRHDSDTEMAFTRGDRAGMAMMLAGFIDHFENQWREGGA